MLEADPERLAQLINDVNVDGAAHQGLLLGLHYGPYSSLLPLVLARRLGRVSFVLDRRLDPNLVLPAERVRELERAGVLPSGSLAAVDLGSGRGALRRVQDDLATGGAVVLFVDPYFVGPEVRSLALRIGERALRVPRGAAWLADRTGCAVSSVSIRPTRRGHGVALETAADVSEALATLEQHVVADPAPWEGWLRDQAHL